MQIIESILAEVATYGQCSVTGIDLARAAIAASGGTVTWAAAGDTWAVLARGTPGTDYPTL